MQKLKQNRNMETENRESNRTVIMAINQEIIRLIVTPLSHDWTVTALKLSLSPLAMVNADYVFADYYIALYIGAIFFLNPNGRDLSQ